MSWDRMTVGAVLLAAGGSSRMGPSGQHKLLAEFEGHPLVRRTAQTLLASAVSSVLVVTGHRRREIEATLRGLDVQLAFNPAYASGMGTSLACAFSHEGIADQDGILVMLADMPAITTADVNRLVGAFHRQDQASVVRASCDGRPGNPVILPKALYQGMRHLSGDSGARTLIRQSTVPVIDIDIGPAALLDVDTVQDVIRAGGVPKN